MIVMVMVAVEVLLFASTAVTVTVANTTPTGNGMPKGKTDADDWLRITIGKHEHYYKLKRDGCTHHQ
jgi:hypothetical protein